MNSQDNILLFHGGGLGDLVLASDLVHSIRRGLPQNRLFLACLEPVAGIAALMPSLPHHVIPHRLNSYFHEAPTPQLLSELGELSRALAAIQPTILIAGAFQPTWLTWFLAACLRPARAIGYVPAEPPRGLLPCLLDEFGLAPAAFETCGGGPFAHETERYAALSRQLGVEPLPSPVWTLPEEAGSAAADCLRRLELESGNYLVCFPFGAVAEKCWPVERFRAVLEMARAEFGVPVLLLGSRAEERGIEELRSSLTEARAFVGDPSGLPVVAGLLARCRAWFGNDTGPMHLGQAYRRPGVAVFGGGAGTAYGPWAPGAIGLIHPLPCFGCLWDCTFGHGVCVESIPVGPVMDALREALRAAPVQAEMRTLNFQPEGVRQLIGHAEARYRQAARDRRQRLEVLVELRREADTRLDSAARTASELTAGLQQFSAIADDRGRALIEKDIALEQMRQIAEERAQALVAKDGAIEQMRQVAEERGEALVVSEAALQKIRHVAEERARFPVANNAALEQMRRVAEERAQALVAKDAALEQMRRVAEERAQALVAKNAALDQMRHVAEERAEALREKEECIDWLATEAAERQRIALELDAALRIALDGVPHEEPDTPSGRPAVEAVNPEVGGR